MTQRKAPRFNKAQEKMESRKNSSMFYMFLFAIGLAVFLWVAWLDIKYSYDGLLPVLVDSQLCWAFAIGTTPIQVGALHLLQRENKHEMPKWQQPLWIGMLAVAFGIDIYTNWLGMAFNMAGTASLSVLQGEQLAVAIGVGLLMAFSEYIIEGMLKGLASFRARYKHAAGWLEDQEFDADIRHAERAKTREKKWDQAYG